MPFQARWSEIHGSLRSDDGEGQKDACIWRAKRLKMLDAKYEYVSGEIHNGTDHHHDGANDLLMPQLVVSWYWS